MSNFESGISVGDWIAQWFTSAGIEINKHFWTVFGEYHEQLADARTMTISIVPTSRYQINIAWEKNGKTHYLAFKDDHSYPFYTTEDGYQLR